MKRLSLLSLLAITPCFAQEVTVVKPAQPAPAAAVTAVAETKNGLPLGAVLNLFIQGYSYNRIEWQRDIHLTKDSAPPLGRLMGQSQILGSYTYRPATFGELTAPQRQEVMNDPRLPGWIQNLAARNQLIGRTEKPVADTVYMHFQPNPSEPLLSAERDVNANYQKYEYHLTPEDLLNDQILHIRLDH